MCACLLSEKRFNGFCPSYMYMYRRIHPAWFPKLSLTLCHGICVRFIDIDDIFLLVAFQVTVQRNSAILTASVDETTVKYDVKRRSDSLILHVTCIAQR